MYLCPKCDLELGGFSSPNGQFWACARCRGRAINLAVLRRNAPESAVESLWRTVWDEPHHRRRRCPCCRQPMCEVKPSPEGLGFPIDACKNCQFIWFDAGEFETLPPRNTDPTADPDESLPPAAFAELARLRAKRSARRLHSPGEKQGTAADFMEVLEALMRTPLE